MSLQRLLFARTPAGAGTADTTESSNPAAAGQCCRVQKAPLALTPSPTLPHLPRAPWLMLPRVAALGMSVARLSDLDSWASGSRYVSFLLGARPPSSSGAKWKSLGKKKFPGGSVSWCEWRGPRTHSLCPWPPEGRVFVHHLSSARPHVYTHEHDHARTGARACDDIYFHTQEKYFHTRKCVQ